MTIELTDSLNKSANLEKKISITSTVRTFLLALMYEVFQQR